MGPKYEVCHQFIQVNYMEKYDMVSFTYRALHSVLIRNSQAYYSEFPGIYDYGLVILENSSATVHCGSVVNICPIDSLVPFDHFSKVFLQYLISSPGLSLVVILSE